MSSAVINETVAAIRADVQARGLLAVSRDLKFNRQSLASVLAGSAREGTTALAVLRWQELAAKQVQS